jgi:predicted dehydrogenase
MSNRIAVIGAGPWGRNHIQTLHELGELSLVVEQVESLHLEIHKRAPGVTISSTASHEELRASGTVGVVIATPAITHASIAVPLLEAGFDVLVEKPMALEPADAVAICDAAEANNRVVMVGHMLLFQPAIAFMKTMIVNGEIGSLRGIYARRRNFGRVRVVENSMWSLGVHDVAVLLDLVGSAPLQLQATGQWLLGNDIADDVTLQMRFANDVYASLHTSWLWPEKDRGLTIVGSKAMLTYDEETQTVTRHAKKVVNGSELLDSGTDVVFQGEAQPLRAELESFVAAIESRYVPIASGRSGLDVTVVLNEAQLQLNAAQR